MLINKEKAKLDDQTFDMAKPISGDSEVGKKYDVRCN